MGSKVVVTRSKLDLLADSVSAKSGESLPLTIGEMKVAVDSIVLNSQIIGDGELDVDENDYLYFDDDGGGGGGITPTGTINITTNGTHDVTNYASANVNVTPSLQSKSATPTESSQTVTPDTGHDGLSSVEVGAISSTYVGSGIEHRDDTDLTVSGETITAPAGYYAESVSKSVASGTAGTPTASKGTVSNHQVSITPSVTNTTGYITGGTKTGTAVTVNASELVSGTKNINQNGTGIDVTNYANVNVTVPSGGLTTVTIFPEQSVTATTADTSGYNVYLDSIAEQLTADTNYIVTLDGDPYLCYSANIYGGSDIYAGDVDVVWGNPANAIYPFALGSYANGRTQWMIADNSVHTVKIERVVSFEESTLTAKNITANGTYNPASDNVDGYSSVTVSIPFSIVTVSSSSPSGGNDGDIWIKTS